METSDFDYHLPPELIAQRPPDRRGDSRMMVVHKESGLIEHRKFSDLGDYLKESDLLVLNDTRVVPARYFSNDGRKEILRIEAISPTVWKCLVKPGRKLREGKTIEIGDATGTILEILEEGGERIIEFDREPDEENLGHLALPPYIERADEDSDKERYQTVFAKEEGAIAAPTAGLHFSDGDLEKWNHAFVTLHVGIGTFRPVSVENLAEHHMHSERYTLSPRACEQINSADRVVAIGTTTVRVLESCFEQSGNPLKPQTGETDIFIFPPHDFGVVDVLLTNFHLPKSTLMMLVSALADRELIMKAYEEAVKEHYRFFSYGDCMLIV